MKLPEGLLTALKSTHILLLLLLRLCWSPSKFSEFSFLQTAVELSSASSRFLDNLDIRQKNPSFSWGMISRTP